MDHFDVGTFRVACIGVGLSIFTANRVIDCWADATLALIAFALVQYSNMSTSCLATIGISLSILATNRIVLRCANTIVVDALALGCYCYLRSKTIWILQNAYCKTCYMINLFSK